MVKDAQARCYQDDSPSYGDVDSRKSSGYEDDDEVDELTNFLGALSPYTGFVTVSTST